MPIYANFHTFCRQNDALSSGHILARNGSNSTYSYLRLKNFPGGTHMQRYCYTHTYKITNIDMLS